MRMSWVCWMCETWLINGRTGRKNRTLGIRCFLECFHKSLCTRMSAMVWFVGSLRQESSAITSWSFSFSHKHGLFLGYHVGPKQRRADSVVVAIIAQEPSFMHTPFPNTSPAIPIQDPLSTYFRPSRTELPPLP